MNRIILAAIAACLLVGWGYYHFLYPPSVLRRATEKTLEGFADSVATHDRAAIGAVLQRSLADAAKIHLEVSFFSLTQTQGKPVTQDFDKAGFIRFLDNVLYTLENYTYQPELQGFTLSKDGASADVTFTSLEWADGTSYYGGVAVGMRFTSTTDCTGRVVFREKAPLLEQASCAVHMHAVPKPEEAVKIQQNPEALRQLLR